MLTVHVHIHVKAEQIEQFKAATIVNASHSLKEPGIARFDLIQQIDDPTRFILVEVYKNEEAARQHKETAHYPVWRDTVAEMMAEPRVAVKFLAVYPLEQA